MPEVEYGIYCGEIVERVVIRNANGDFTEYLPVVHGRWEDKPTGRYGRWQSWCSACGKHSGIGGIEGNRHKPYCPNCGAKMDKEATNES